VFSLLCDIYWLFLFERGLLIIACKLLFLKSLRMFKSLYIRASEFF